MRSGEPLPPSPQPQLFHQSGAEERPGTREGIRFSRKERGGTPRESRTDRMPPFLAHIMRVERGAYEGASVAGGEEGDEGDLGAPIRAPSQHWTHGMGKERSQRERRRPRNEKGVEDATRNEGRIRAFALFPTSLGTPTPGTASEWVAPGEHDGSSAVPTFFRDGGATRSSTVERRRVPIAGSTPRASNDATPTHSSRAHPTGPFAALGPVQGRPHPRASASIGTLIPPRDEVDRAHATIRSLRRS